MKRRIALRTIAACCLSLGLAHGAAASTLFGSTFTGAPTANLFTVNQSNGALTSVGPMSANIGDLTSNGSTVWGVDLTSNSLYTVNTATGAATSPVAITGAVGTITSIAFDTATNTMYGNTTASFGGGDFLYSINVATGAATLIGNGLGVSNIFALGFAGGNLYGVGDNTNQLVSISTTTGAASVIGSTGLGSVFDIAARPEDGEVFAADSGTFSLYTVNLTTGVMTLVGAYGSTANVAGLAFVGEVPEPSTYALMLGGLLGLGFVARRRKTA